MEQRVVANKPKIGTRKPEPKASAQPAKPVPQNRRRSRLMLLLVVTALASGVGYWFLVPRASEGEGEAPPMPGETVTVGPLSLNLADGRYLRLAVGLQMRADVEQELVPAKAEDILITTYSGRPLAEVSSAEGREALKAAAAERILDAYEGDVIAVFLTDYVTQ